MLIGPQVAFVDDIEEQIQPLVKAIAELNAGSIYFNAKPDLSQFPDEPLETVKLLFLDLLYKKDFDAEMSAQWVVSIIPPNTKYSLIIWSKDTDDVEKLFQILEEIDMMPTYREVWQKTEFSIETYNFKDKIQGLIKNISDEEVITQELIYGEIVEVEDDGILVNCRINLDPPVYQIRRFDKELLSNIDNLHKGTFVKINVYTKPGSRLIDFFEEKRDRRDHFEVQDFFEGLEGGAFFIQG